MGEIYEKCLKNAQPIQQKMEENLYNIRILDATIKQIEKELKQKLTQMANTLKKTSKDERRRQYEAIEKLYERAKNLSDDKIRLAESNYEMVDVFIQKLDKETSSFNSYAECVQRSNGRTHSSAGTSKDSTEVKARTEEQQPPAVSRRRGTAPASSSSINSHSLKRGTAGRTNAKETANLVKNEATEPDNIGAKGDMPIDPNEPRYCFCQQVSFGHMVACDNKDCSLEWFHFDCVDLKASPKGKWFCPKCRDDKDSTRRQQQQTRTPKSGVRGKDIPSKQ